MRYMRATSAWLLLALCGWTATAQDTVKPETLPRSEVTGTVANARQIVTSQGRGTVDSRFAAIDRVDLGFPDACSWQTPPHTASHIH